MIDGSCHCGAVRFSYPRQPEWLTDCNCTVCRRYSTLWAYAPVGEITMQMAVDATIAYVHGDKTLAMHSCKTCGCTTHWMKLEFDESSRMGVNFRMCEPDDIENIRVRHLDGKDTWDYLD